MPVTTFLHEGELNQPTGDPELDAYWDKARQLTGQNYQILTKKVPWYTSTWWYALWHNQPCKHKYELYLETGGVGPYQLIDTENVFAYLQGIVDTHIFVNAGLDKLLDQAREMGRNTLKQYEESKKHISYTSGLRDAVVLARNTFEGYAALHMEKGTDEGVAEARLNFELAKQMNNALLPEKT